MLFINCRIMVVMLLQDLPMQKPFCSCCSCTPDINLIKLFIITAVVTISFLYYFRRSSFVWYFLCFQDSFKGYVIILVLTAVFYLLAVFCVWCQIQRLSCFSFVLSFSVFSFSLVFYYTVSLLFAFWRSISLLTIT